MKILYALQATGNGHIARANVLVPKLKEHAQVDVFISGQNAQLHFKGDATKNKGLSLFYSENGGLNYAKILRKNSLMQFVKSVHHFPVQPYDLIINDFEPITAYSAKLRNKKIIGLSHQSAVLHKLAPQPEKRHRFSKWVLQKYAPVEKSFGFHFTKYDENTFHPIIRDTIKKLNCANEDYFLVYLPSYKNEEIYKVLSKLKHVDWMVFSPFSKVSKKQGNCTFFPIDEQLFTSYLATAKGVLCGAGFEFPAEVLHLKKMLFVIPIKGQFEQYCNYLALKQLGVMGAEDLCVEKIDTWIASNHIAAVSFTDETDLLIEKVLNA
ncbi:glycosyl transferase [Flavobacterium sp. CBA20B-1]|uniref:glycosyltransferase family protein n=1 Tax=unclassified Flavobacterium TaxID=196869 RepID=UPI002223F534|nr:MULTISPECIES: glycosyltransferase family protein [unclassified Flavobacterium]WCM41101.1 glycosyl transferase [Flavobacterium sp. CBA20B-1]